MDRRSLLLGIVATVVQPLAPTAQPRGKPLYVGWLSSATPKPGPEDWRPFFEQQLRKLGWDLRYELRYAEGDGIRLAHMADDLVRSNVQVIVAADTVAARAAKTATSTVPIVFVGSADPVGSGLVASLARPGGNATGGSSRFDDGVAGKWLELLRQVRAVKNVAVIWDPTFRAAAPLVTEIEQAAATFGVALEKFPGGTTEEVEALIVALGRRRIDGVILCPDLTLLRHARRIMDASHHRRIPLVSAWRPHAELTGGAVLAFGPSLPENYRVAAIYVDKIARGASPATLPVEQLLKLDLVINLKTANTLGLTIPPSLLLRADQVFE